MQLNMFSNLAKRIAIVSKRKRITPDFSSLIQKLEASPTSPFKLFYCAGLSPEDDGDIPLNDEDLWPLCEAKIREFARKKHKDENPHLYIDGIQNVIIPTNLNDSSSTLELRFCNDGEFSGCKLQINRYFVFMRSEASEEREELLTEEAVIVQMLSILDEDDQILATGIGEPELPFDLLQSRCELRVSELTKKLARSAIPIHEWATGQYENVLPQTQKDYEIIDSIMQPAILNAIEKVINRTQTCHILIIDHGCGNARLIAKLFSGLKEEQKVHVSILGYDPNERALQFAQDSPLGREPMIRLVNATTDEIHAHIQNPERVTHVFHLDSGGPIHLQVVTYEEAKRNLDTILGLSRAFPALRQTQIFSSGKTASFFTHQEFESKGFTTLTYGIPTTEAGKQHALYHGLQYHRFVEIPGIVSTSA